MGIVLFAFLFVTASVGFAQENITASPITIEKSFWGTKYTWNGQRCRQEAILLRSWLIMRNVCQAYGVETPNIGPV
jgi:hypothetical protein